MASEKQILQALDALTTSNVESLGAKKKDSAQQLRQILDSPNVVGVGISEKISKGKRMGILALTFYVIKKINRKKLLGHEMVPPAIPPALSGPQAISTDVFELGGPIVLQANVNRSPIQPGFSIGHVKVTAGTLGAVVNGGGKKMLLSNSHVFANSGKAKAGDKILYPGKADGGKSPADVVATLTKFGKFVVGGDYVNSVDCAVATPTAAALAKVQVAIPGIGVPKGTTAAQRGMKVVIEGRTSGKSTGEVKDTHFRFTVTYPGVGKVGFKDQILCTRYSKGGDSGSLVLDQKTSKAVGLHFAGAPEGSVSNPIGLVLKNMGVTLAAGGPAPKTPKPPKAKPPIKKPGKKPVKKSVKKAAKQ